MIKLLATCYRTLGISLKHLGKEINLKNNAKLNFSHFLGQAQKLKNKYFLKEVYKNSDNISSYSERSFYLKTEQPISVERISKNSQDELEEFSISSDHSRVRRNVFDLAPRFQSDNISTRGIFSENKTNRFENHKINFKKLNKHRKIADSCFFKALKYKQKRNRRKKKGFESFAFRSRQYDPVELDSLLGGLISININPNNNLTKEYADFEKRKKFLNRELYELKSLEKKW